MSEETTNDTSAEESVASMVGTPVETTSTEAAGRPDHIPEKFWDTEKNAVNTDNMAKSYGELEKKFGAFTGSPDEYSFNVSEEMDSKFQEMGMEVNKEDPLLQAAMEMAKDTGMNQEGFDKLANLYLMTQLGDHEAHKADQADQMAQLGDRATQRIANIDAYCSKHLDTEAYSKMDKNLNADMVMVFEQLIASTQNAPISDVAATQAPAVSESDVKAMQFATDEFGNRRTQTDPEFRRLYQQKLKALHGDGENRIVVGG